MKCKICHAKLERRKYMADFIYDISSNYRRRSLFIMIAAFPFSLLLSYLIGATGLILVFAASPIFHIYYYFLRGFVEKTKYQCRHCDTIIVADNNS